MLLQANEEMKLIENNKDSLNIYVMSEDLTRYFPLSF